MYLPLAFDLDLVSESVRARILGVDVGEALDRAPKTQLTQT